MFISLKTKIWLTILAIVLMFTFFTLYYFPRQEREFLLRNYNNEIQNLANTVALGVKISLNEQYYEGVKTAMDFVKNNPDLKFVSLVQTDTIWDNNRKNFTVKDRFFQTYPEDAQSAASLLSTDSVIVKKAAFETSIMSGSVVLGLTTKQINESEKKIRLTSLIVSGCIFVLGILMGLWLSRNISIPVIALRNAANRVGEGDLTPTVKSFSNDEIGELAKTFNKMVGDLSMAREELNDTNKTLSSTNTTLSDTLENLKAAQAQLVQSEKMASLGELTAGIAHEIQNPLNFINNFADINNELIDEMLGAAGTDISEEMKSLGNDVKTNNDKIVFHGKRADAIVKGMLQHSRKNSGQKESTDINALCDEYFRLSYHGLRAKDKNFNADFITGFDDSIEEINIVSQDIGRVLLNLFNNAFYAVNEKKKLSANSYQPMAKVITRKLNNAIEIRVSDNGNGIPQNIVDKIFQPFFTTKPTGEGTGLGLSLSYDIIKAHGGEIKVETGEGEGSTFTIMLPS